MGRKQVPVGNDWAEGVVLYDPSGVAVSSVNGAAVATEVASGTADAQAVAALASLRFLGFSVRENAAGAAEFIIRHGTQATDPPLAFVKLAAGESVREWYGPQGLVATNGIFVDRVSGTTHLVVYSTVAP